LSRTLLFTTNAIKNPVGGKNYSRYGRLPGGAGVENGAEVGDGVEDEIDDAVGMMGVELVLSME
jgi:hypothetical protein